MSDDDNNNDVNKTYLTTLENISKLDVQVSQ
jgi:hypothetical protein